MQFQLGDKVSFLNEKLDGVVSKVINPKMVEVRTEDGFDIPVLVSELVLVQKAELNKVERKIEKLKEKEAKRKVDDDVFAPKKKIKKVKEKTIDREYIREALKDRMAPKVVGKISLKHSHRRPEVQEEVDLHIEQLLDRWKHLSNGEIVQHQLSVARQSIDDAILAGKHRIVLIHGVGSGTLKKEVIKLIESYPGLRHEEGHFSVYGVGATLVHL